jgi:Putative zinc-finger
MMSKTHLPHPTEDVLEQYAMGALSEAEIDMVEEHLLVCTACQDSLTATDDFVRAARIATEELASQPQPESWWSTSPLRKIFTMPAPILAAAACATLAVVMLLPRQTPTAEVQLMAMRGPETAAQAPANAALTLRLSLDGLEVSGPLQAQVADSTGRIVLESPVERSGAEAVAKTEKLAPGTYWVRLYSEATMLREYPLSVR